MKQENGAVLWWAEISIAVEIAEELDFQQKKMLFTLLLSWMDFYINYLQRLLLEKKVWFCLIFFQWKFKKGRIQLLFSELWVGILFFWN